LRTALIGEQRICGGSSDFGTVAIWWQQGFGSSSNLGGAGMKQQRHFGGSSELGALAISPPPGRRRRGNSERKSLFPGRGSVFFLDATFSWTSLP